MWQNWIHKSEEIRYSRTHIIIFLSCMLQGTRFLSACPILCFFIACSWCFLFKLVACRKLYVKYDMEIVSMAFLNIVLLLSIPYFDVRVLTIALLLVCLHAALGGPAHMPYSIFKAILFFLWHVLSFFKKTFTGFCVFMLIFCYSGFCTNRNKSVQVQYTGEGVLFL